MPSPVWAAHRRLSGSAEPGSSIRRQRSSRSSENARSCRHGRGRPRGRPLPAAAPPTEPAPDRGERGGPDGRAGSIAATRMVPEPTATRGSEATRDAAAARCPPDADRTRRGGSADTWSFGGVVGESGAGAVGDACAGIVACRCPSVGGASRVGLHAMSRVDVIGGSGAFGVRRFDAEGGFSGVRCSSIDGARLDAAVEARLAIGQRGFLRSGDATGTRILCLRFGADGPGSDSPGGHP
jgi:hypothetical protein